MIKLLPFILVPVLILGALGYWRFVATKPPLTVSQDAQTEVLTEVPQTLPPAGLEDRVENLENTVVKLAQSSPRPTGSQIENSGSLESRLANAEAGITEIKARVSALEKGSPAAGQSTVYIPLGSGGGPWLGTPWFTLSEYEISLNPDNYPGYKAMYLEVIVRGIEANGTGSIRLYNVTDSSAVSTQLDFTSTSFTLKTSSSFTLPAGTKTYRLQLQSTESKQVFIQSARIKVNF